MATEKYYKKGDVIGEFLKKRRLEAISSKINGKLLDLACGENDLVRNYSGDGKGIDIADYGADQVVSDYHNLPFESGSFDTVSIIASLNYFEDPLKVLIETGRLLQDDGRLIITNTNHNVMKAWHLFRESWAHKSGYSLSSIKSLLSQSSFEVENISYFNFYLSYVITAKKRG